MQYLRTKYLLTMWCLLLLAVTTHAQQMNYPAMVNVQLNPPYSLYLSDYSEPELQRMQVHLLLKDLTESNYKCRLRLKIEGIGITLQSKTGFYVPPILINGGEMITISGPELAPYLNPQNLLIQGLDNSAFTKNGAKLPEGIYKFTVELLDYTRNTVISNAGNAIIAGFLSYPPIINLPFQDTKVTAMDPQNVVFQWMPRHTASINAAFNVVYKLRLVELIPANRDPNDAIRSLKPIYENIVQQSMLVYGPGEPALTPGNNYAVQIQAIEADGKDMFVNDGYSEVVRFTYGEKCSVPQQIVASFAGKNELKLTWPPTISQQSYTIRYREAGDQPSQWYEDDSYLPQITLRGLKPGKKYEFQVKAQCIWGYGDYSLVSTFTMPNETMTTGDFVCGKNSNIAKIRNTKGIEQLTVQDTILASDFRVIITSISSSNGSFTGEGYIDVIPFLALSKLPVTFKGINVNTEKRMFSGAIELKQDSYAKVEKDMGQAIDDYLKRVDDILNLKIYKELLTVDVIPLMAEIDKIKAWDELDDNTIARLEDVQSKLQEIKDYQSAYAGMSPEERSEVGDKLVKDLGKAKKGLNDALAAAKELSQKVLDIFRKAVLALKNEKADAKKIAEAEAAFKKADDDTKALLLDIDDAANREFYPVTDNKLSPYDANTPPILITRLKAMNEKSKLALLVLLADNKDEQINKQIIHQLDFDGSTLDELLTEKKRETQEEENTVLEQVKKEIWNLIEKAIIRK